MYLPRTDCVLKSRDGFLDIVLMGVDAGDEIGEAVASEGLL